VRAAGRKDNEPDGNDNSDYDNQKATKKIKKKEERNKRKWRVLYTIINFLFF